MAASEGIFALLAEFKRSDPSYRPWWERPDWKELSEAEQHQAFVEHTHRSVEHMNELLHRFNTEFAGETLALFDEFSRRGLTDDSAREIRVPAKWTDRR